MGELGPLLRSLREDDGLTLGGMAKLTNYSKAYLSMVERGRRPATADIVRAYETALSRSASRRSLLTGLLAGAVAPETMFDGIRAGFEDLLNSARPHVDEWAARVQAYGQDYMRLGAGELQARLARDLIVLRGTLDAPELWAAAAKLLTVHGKTLPSADEGGAIGWYRLAAQASDRSGDLDVRIWVRGRAALALAYEGAGLPAALTLAEQALALSDRHSLGSVNAHMALAHVAAHRGDTDGAVAHAEAGERAFDVAGSHEQVSDFAVPQWRMATFASMLWSRLGDARALAAQDEADRYRPATLPRFAAHIELHRGLYLARSGDLAGGRAQAEAAMAKLPPEKHSLSLRLMAAEVRALTTPR